MRIIPRQPQPLGELDDDPEVFARLTGRLSALRPSWTMRSVLVTVPSFPARPCRQNDVREVGGLGEEDVLHHQVLELGHGRARVPEIGSDIAGFSP